MEKSENKWEKLKNIIIQDMRKYWKEYQKTKDDESLIIAATENWILERMEEIEKVD